MPKTKLYSVRFERVVLYEVKIETTSQKEALNLARKGLWDYNKIVVEGAAPKYFHIKGKSKRDNAERLFNSYRTYANVAVRSRGLGKMKLEVREALGLLKL
jgi:hypothetical protein